MAETVIAASDDTARIRAGHAGGGIRRRIAAAGV
jgi:hypothetical protein